MERDVNNHIIAQDIKINYHWKQILVVAQKQKDMSYSSYLICCPKIKGTVPLPLF
jgi:hypothetical protein